MTPVNKASKMRVLAVSLGTLVEWAEFSYYAYLARELSALFFPQYSVSNGVLLTFLIFALGYLARPIGALYFGHLGDCIGRRHALIRSISLMGLSSFLIGCLPTYQSIGPMAAYLLLFLRCLQGFAVSGEFNGAAIYLIEQALNKKVQAGSFSGLAAAIGMVIGSLMALVVAAKGMPQWAWRVPFLLGALSCLIAFVLRCQAVDSSRRRTSNQRQTTWPIVKLITHYKPPLLITMLLSGAMAVYIYTMNIYYASHLVQYELLTAYQAKWVVSVAQWLVVFCIVAVGMVADKVGAKRLLRAGFSVMFLVVPLVYWCTSQGSLTLILLVQLPYAIGNAMVGVPIFKCVNDLFPATVRYSGVSLGWGLGMAIFGGSAPIVATTLQSALNWQAAPSLYILSFAAVALVVSDKTPACSSHQ